MTDFKADVLQQQTTTPGATPVWNRLQFEKVNQKLTVEDQKTVDQTESQFQMQNSVGRVRIWQKQHESTDPSCFVLTVQAAAAASVIVMQDIFLAHFGLLGAN